MCGVFGFTSKANKPIDLGILREVATVTNQRGPHAWGMAWIDSRGRLCCYKQTGPVTDALGLLSMARDARALIGHCRYATQGDPDEAANNHPHPVDGGWLVHNGVIAGYHTVMRHYSLHPVSACDSELLGLLMEQFNGDLVERADQATEAVLHFRPSPLVMLGLWKPGTLVAVRKGNPLQVANTRKGVWLASLPEGMPGKPKPVTDNHVLQLSPA